MNAEERGVESGGYFPKNASLKTYQNRGHSLHVMRFLVTAIHFSVK
jgi:hypothetical protein